MPAARSRRARTRVLLGGTGLLAGVLSGWLAGLLRGPRAPRSPQGPSA